MNVVMRIFRASLGLSLSVGAILAAAPAAHAAGAAAPYTDPSVKGYIGLCDKAGNQIRSGSTKTTPFAYRAVSSVPALAPYNATGRTATLFIYQPRPGVPAGEWSGELVTASARYSNPAHPMAAATTGDDSLADYISDYRPMWDGFLQVRLYLGVPAHAAYVLNYPALNIKVTGNTWHQVGGGTVDCTSGTAESLETQVLPKSDLKPKPTPKPGGTGVHQTSKPTPNKHHPSSPPSQKPSGGNSTPSQTPLAHSTTASSNSGSSSTPVWIVVAILVALLLLTGGFAFRRRSTATPATSAHDTNKKGR